MENNTITESALYLTFRLEDELFAINVSQVREVLDLDTITKVPRTLDFMRGVINVRGSVVPVMDLRMKFGISKTVNTHTTRIIVMELLIDNELTVLGAIADSVHEVIELEPEQIEPPPKIGNRWRTDVIKGVGKRNDQFIIILDIDKVFSAEELAVVQEVEKEINPVEPEVVEAA
ncbi:chemotaxis protein CheW [Thermodesulfobacteriota bacterium]